MELGRRHGRRRVAREQREELVVQRREPVFLLQELVDPDRADGSVLDPERNADQRLFHVVAALAVAARHLAAGHAAADDPGTQGHAREFVERQPLARDGLETTCLLIGHVDGEHLGADQVDDDLQDDLENLAEIERRVELEARDVEVREVVVLFLDLEIAGGELAILLLDGPQALRHVALLDLQTLDARQQLLTQLVPLGVTERRSILSVLDVGENPPEPLVLEQKLLGEFRPATEQAQELVGLVLDVVTHSVPSGVFKTFLALGIPDRIAGAICARGRTASTAPVRIAWSGIPKITAVSSDSATTTPPASLTATAPRRPSSPMPVSTTAISSSPQCFEADSNIRSIEGAYLSCSRDSSIAATTRPPSDWKTR